MILDLTPAARGAEWMSRLRKIDPEGFTTAMRTRADRLYSELSKGIHHEFVIPLVNQYGTATVSDLLIRSWEFVATLGITTCHSPILRSLGSADAIERFEQAQRELL